MASTGSLFGQQSAQSGQNSSSSLLGNRMTQPQPQIGMSGLFSQGMGSNGAQQNASQAGPAAQRSLFSASAPPNASQGLSQPRAPVSIFSGSIGQHGQNQTTVPGVRISVNELRPTTRFNDLHEELQKTIEFVDSFILNKIQWQEQCEASTGKLEEMSQQIAPDVAHLTQSHNTVQRALEVDAGDIAHAKSLVRSDAQDAMLSFKSINNLKLPRQFHQSGVSSWGRTSTDATVSTIEDSYEPGASRTLVEYFSRQSDEMSKSLASYSGSVDEVERYLQNIEMDILAQLQNRSDLSQPGSGGDSEGQIKELVNALRSFEHGILGVATKVGHARQSVQDAMLGSS